MIAKLVSVSVKVSSIERHKEWVMKIDVDCARYGKPELFEQVFTVDWARQNWHGPNVIIREFRRMAGNFMDTVRAEFDTGDTDTFQRAIDEALQACDHDINENASEAKGHADTEIHSDSAGIPVAQSGRIHVS